MKAARNKELLEWHEESIAEGAKNYSIDQLAKMASVVFPRGTLPEESDPVRFTVRELEIVRLLLWPSRLTKDRKVRAMLNERGFLFGIVDKETHKKVM